MKEHFLQSSHGTEMTGKIDPKFGHHNKMDQVHKMTEVERLRLKIGQQRKGYLETRRL